MCTVYLPSHNVHNLLFNSQVKAEISCGSRRSLLMDNSSQPIALLPAKAT
jgi:hypothetical protein